MNKEGGCPARAHHNGGRQKGHAVGELAHAQALGACDAAALARRGALAWTGAVFLNKTGRLDSQAQDELVGCCASYRLRLS